VTGSGPMRPADAAPLFACTPAWSTPPNVRLAQEARGPRSRK
jgi:hypothetical protein